MPGITNPAEEYFKDGLWAWVTNAWKKLVATAGGALHIYVAGQAADVEVTQTAAADLVTGGHGWSGSAWQKLPMIFGYSDVYVEQEYHTALADGDILLTFSTVGAGELWVVTFISALCATNNPSLVQLYPVVGGGRACLDSKAYTTAPESQTWYGPIYLKHNDSMGVRFKDCLNEDFVVAYAHGYKMKIAE